MMGHLVKTEGFSSLFRSLPVTVLMNVPQAALFMTFYENLKSFIFPEGEVSMKGYFSCAGVSAGLSAVICNPLDMVKTRLQTQSEQGYWMTGCEKKAKCPNNKCTDLECCGDKKYCKKSSKNCKKPRYCSVKGTVKVIYEEEGFKGFMRGAGPRMMLFLPGAAVSWAAYEYIKSLIV